MDQDPDDAVPLHTLTGHTEWVTCVAYSPDGTLLASGSGDSTVRLWDSETGRPVRTLTLGGRRRPGPRRLPPSSTRVAFSPDGRLLTSSGSDKKIRIWDVETGNRLRVLKVRTEYSWESASSVAFDPDGTRLAAAWTDGSLRVWQVDRWQHAWSWDARHRMKAEIRAREGRLRGVNGTAFSPDGAWLAAADQDGSVALWDATTGECRRKLNGHTEQVNMVAFSPDGTRLASGSNDRMSMLWDPVVGRLLWTLIGHTGRVTDVAYSPDGSLLATSSNDGSVRGWQAATGRHLWTLHARAGLMLGLAFSPDGTRLATASHDQVVQVWDTTAW